MRSLKQLAVTSGIGADEFEKLVKDELVMLGAT
jgi:hypothetical protein